MSQKSQADLHRSSAEIAAPQGVVKIVPPASPVVMITSASTGIFVADHRLTKWEKVSELPRSE